MTLQNILTLSIDAIALSFAAIMIIDFAFTLAAAWCASSNPSAKGMCTETLAPIFEEIVEEVPEIEMCTKMEIGAHLVNFSIRELKKQASVAKIKNYSVLNKAQLVEALAA